jgi:membrane-bound serine protease (ClpP class)
MWTIILTVICVAAFFIAVIALAAKAYLKRPSTGKEGIVGKRGIAKTNINEDGGKAYIYGEWWEATSVTPIKKGDKVEVVESVDLGVRVKKI